MNHPHLKRLLQFGILLLVGVILAFLFFSLNKISSIEKNSAAITEDRETLFLTQKIVSHTVHFEIDLKGSLGLAHKNFVVHEDAFNQKLITDFNQLKLINKNKPSLIKWIDSLYALLQHRYQDNAQTFTALKNKTATEAEINAFITNGYLFIDQIQAIAKSIENTANSTLVQEETFDQNNLHYLGNVFYISVFILILLFISIILLYQTNIFQLRQKNKELANLSNMIDQSEDAVIFIDENFNIKTFSKGAEKISGFTAAEAFENSKLLFSRLHYKTQQQRDENRKILFETGRFTSQVKFTKKDNANIYLFISMTAIKNETGNIAGFVGFVKNISEMKIAEEKIHFLGTVIKQSNDAIIITEVAESSFINNITGWNKGAEQLYGLTEAEAIGKTRAEIFRNNITNEQRRDILEEVKTKGSWKGYETHLNKDNKILHVIHSMSAVFNKSGKFVGTVSSITDISDLKKAEEKINELTKAVEQSNDAVILVQKNKTILNWNKGAEKIYGYNLEEAVGKNFDDLLLYDKNKFSNEIIVQYESVGHYKLENIHRRKDGSLILISSSVTYLKNDTGETYGFLCVIDDITQRKQTEEKMFLLSKIIESTSDAIYTTDKFTRITSWNKGAEKLYGFTEKEALGNKTLEMLNVQQNVIKDISTFDYTKDFFSKKESIHHKKNGEAIIVEVSLNYLADKNENGYFLIIATDVTEKKAEEKRILELANSFALTRDTILLLDKNQCIMGWNKGAISMYGYSEREALGKNVDDLVVEQISFNSEIAEANKDKFYWRGESWHKRKDGNVFPVILSVTFLKDESSQITGYLILVIDITEQKQMEERLRNMNGILEYEVEEKTSEIRDVFERINEGFVALDNSFRLTYTNKIVTSLLKKDLKEIVGKNILDVMPDLDKNLIRAYERAKEEQRSIQLEDFFPIFNAWLYVSMYPSAKGVSIFLKDITDQKQAQEDLAKINYRLRNLSAHIQNSREEERMNIAREIHDELGQLTTALKIDMAWVKKKMAELDNDNPKTIARVDDMLGLLHEMVTTIRRISQELRPSILDNLGLSAAVEWYLKEFEKRTNIKTTFDNTLDDEDEQLPNLIKTSLFRICQESLTNVMRHAQATKVNCELQKIDAKKIVLQIRDNGKGFDINQKTKSFGLLGMQERAGMINGSIIIKSEINKGTTIHIEVEI